MVPQLAFSSSQKLIIVPAKANALAIPGFSLLCSRISNQLYETTNYIFVMIFQLCNKDVDFAEDKIRTSTQKRRVGDSQFCINAYIFLFPVQNDFFLIYKEMEKMD